ncbi:hypothetical protein OK142_09780 [Agrobacterium sp. BT-220-3]|uniref:Uncharacterized protein n=1 Tax=Agrobacterium larrymoorei TaxID=160699 RepID=A0AAF0HBU6_9HYPH|nr:hypothetical protein [Agrobacterium larrymoorei]MCW0981100.1 hypothetical protein [Agrobacterium sp. BT-220-3]WHA42977.1 hypothetical protein CFBP5477_017075 [Agrobacterium larrymoorei]
MTLQVSRPNQAFNLKAMATDTSTQANSEEVDLSAPTIEHGKTAINGLATLRRFSQVFSNVERDR